MAYQIKHFIASDGERFSQLYDTEAGGFPLYYPTAFITRVVRTECTHETQKVYLEALKRVCEWEHQQGISLTERLQRKDFLRQYEMDTLVKHLSASRRESNGEVISRRKANAYIIYAAKYIRWLTGEVITGIDTNTKASIDEQDEALKLRIARKQGSKAANAQRILASKLPDWTRKSLLDLFADPLQAVKKPADKGPRMRNILMLRVLYETGMRRGELLSLKLANFIEAIDGESAQLLIERNHHDAFDTRANQPVAKTNGRIVDISLEAERQLIDYLERWRPSTESDFVFVNHREGRFHGKPVTQTGFNSALEKLRELYPELTPLHPHLLRHDWNYRFSQEAESKGMDKEEERTLREQLMGWTSNSKMSLLYDQRHIQERASEVGRKIASDTMNREAKNGQEHSSRRNP